MKQLFRRVIFILVILIFLSPLLSVSPAAADGPTDQPTDQPEGFGWTQIGPAGGKFEEIVQNPFDPDMFFAYSGEGLYQSLNSGLSWTEVSMEGIDINTTTPVFMEIAGLVSQELFLIKGTNVYKTAIDQISWQRIAVVTNNSTPMFKVARNDASKMMAAIDDNIKVSGDGGLTWRAVFPRTQFFLIDTINPDRLLVFKDNQFFRSVDFGRNWEVLDTPSLFLNTIKSIDISESDQGVYTLLYYNWAFKTLDFGDSWVAIALPEGTFNALHVSSFDSNILLLESSHSRLAMLSRDGGNSWTTIDQERSLRDRIYIWRLPVVQGDYDILAGTLQAFVKLNAQNEELQRSAQGIHEQFISQMVVNPQNGNELYACVQLDYYAKSKICHYSNDSGVTWQQIEAVVGHLAVNPQRFNEVFWVDFEGLYYYSTDHGSTFTPKGSINGNLFPQEFLVDPHHPGKLIAYRYSTKLEISISNDYGMTWEPLANRPEGYMFFIDPLIPDRFFSTTSYNGFVSNDGGSSWIEMTLPDSIRYPQKMISRVYSGASYLFLPTSNDLSESIWISSDGGMNWTKIAALNYFTDDSMIDHLDTPNGSLTAYCLNCNEINRPNKINYLVDFVGGWDQLPDFPVKKRSVMQLSSTSGIARFYLATEGKSIYYIDLQIPEIEKVYLPLINRQMIVGE